MDQNPYAAPQAPLPSRPPGFEAIGGVFGGEPRNWTAGEVMRTAWESLKPQWLELSLAVFVASALQSLPAFAVLALETALERKVAPLGVIVQIARSGIEMLLQGGLLMMYLKAARGQPTEFADLFRGLRYFPVLFVVEVIRGCIVLLGICALIVPGIIAGLGLSLATCFAIDAKLSGIEAIKASWLVCKPRLGELFLFAIFAGLTLLAGMAAGCVGVFPAVALVGIGVAHIYLHATGRPDRTTLSAWRGW